jgi:hypothetical protein
MPYEIALIGAARRRQGTGPFVAKIFHSLGHQIVGVIGSTLSSGQAARDQLQQDYQITTRAYADLTELNKHHNPQIIAICSPPETHLNYIKQALTHGCHVFCEKPLWWPLCLHYEQEITDLLALAQQHRCFLHLNTQWPYTLRYFSVLHANKSLSPANIDSFSMHLSPESHGEQMLVDSVSHGLGMLYQLLGAGTLDNIRFNCAGLPVNKIDLHFEYQHAQGTTHAHFSLKQTSCSPKPAWYQINNLRVDRQVALPDYQIQLQSTSARCTIIDPLALSIKDFIANIESNIESDKTALLLGAQHMFMLIQAYKQR